MLSLDMLSNEERNIILGMRAKMQQSPAALPGIEPAAGQRRWGQYAPPNPPQVVPVKDAGSIVQKQINNFQAVGQQNYLNGIATPRADPIAAGIAAQPAYEAAMRDPQVLKRREQGLRKTNMNEWALQAETKGASRIVEGVLAAQPKIERFWSQFQPLLTQHVQRIRAMPAVTQADRQNRMIANLHGLRALKGRV